MRVHPVHGPHGSSCKGLDVEFKDGLESTDHMQGRKYFSVSFSQAAGPQEPLPSTLVRHDAPRLRMGAAVVVVIASWNRERAKSSCLYPVVGF